MIVSVCIFIFGTPTCKTIGNYIANYFSAGFFFVGAILCIYAVKKKVIVYKGRIVYCTICKKVEYKPSEVYSSNTKIVQIDYRDEMGGWTSTEDKVTIFCNRDGKKLFVFGLAYENVQRLEKTVTNNIHFCNENLFELQRHVANRTCIIGNVIGIFLIFCALLILIFG